ncbi:hypothetical protein [Thiohalorhabdus methylotrophus]|uniref:Uncharacterized protein n=1 Tax=Thiohalorhabdus methylotrophus TaxID=3242694 RepID=A0ABV4TTB6_9GAMM
MVFRLIGLIGLILLPGLASAAGVSVHTALGNWLSDNGIGTASYQTKDGSGGPPEDWPRWLLRPGDAETLNHHFLRRGIFPESVSLDWAEEPGTVRVFGVTGQRPGLRLLVDRGGEWPVLLRTSSGVRWRFTDFRERGGRVSALPGRIVRTGPEGERTVFTVR